MPLTFRNPEFEIPLGKKGEAHDKYRDWRDFWPDLEFEARKKERRKKDQRRDIRKISPYLISRT